MDILSIICILVNFVSFIKKIQEENIKIEYINNKIFSNSNE
jgi:hypothetical protein